MATPTPEQQTRLDELEQAIADQNQTLEAGVSMDMEDGHQTMIDLITARRERDRLIAERDALRRTIAGRKRPHGLAGRLNSIRMG